MGLQGDPCFILDFVSGVHLKTFSQVKQMIQISFSPLCSVLCLMTQLKKGTV